MLYTNQESFLSELSKLFETGRQSGKSLWITMKRYDGRKTRNPRKPNDKPKKGSVCQGGDLIPNNEYRCMIRAKLGNRKISAVIGQKDMNKFQLSYSNLIKGNIYGLKKQKPSATTTSATVQQQPQSSSSTTAISKGSGGGTHQSK